ncbi:hypothetical protein [Kitasatospora sp. NPDC089509]|uniref:hypothetical protein n=1 Tax=Kitasatospora sp. NPDC089509 TaxID=3364079 RepID=UPI00381B7883
MLRSLRRLMSDPEIRATGQEYRSAVVEVGALDIVPAWVTSKAPTTGITLAQYRARLAVIGTEAKALPHASLADLGAAAAGGEVDSAAFVQGVGEVGFGATVYASAPPETATAPSNPAFTSKIELKQFHVRRAVGDQFGGKDEIYWTVAIQSDLHRPPHYRSQEFGSVKKGDTRAFASNRKVVFDGRVKDGLILNVSVWEADQSNAEWFTKLGEALETFLDTMSDMNIFQQIIWSAQPFDELGLLLDAVSLIVAFWEYFRNNDDLSCTRAIALDNRGLFTLWHRKESVWEFNGDGHHALTVSYSGDRPPLPSGALEYVVRRNGDTTWSAPVNLGWRSAAGAALCEYQGSLYVAYVRPGDHALMWSRCTNGMWSVPARVRSWTTFYQPALTVHQGRLYVSATGENRNVYISRLNASGTAWEGNHQAGGVISSHGPSLFSHSTGLILPTVGTNDIMYLNRAPDPTNWSNPARQSLWKSKQRLSSANNSGWHWLHHIALDGTVHVSVRNGDTYYLKPLPSSFLINPGGTLVSVAGDGVWLIGRDSQGNLVAVCNRGGLDVRWLPMGTIASGVIANEVGAAVVGEDLHVMYQKP